MSRTHRYQVAHPVSGANGSTATAQAQTRDTHVDFHSSIFARQGQEMMMLQLKTVI